MVIETFGPGRTRAWSMDSGVSRGAEAQGLVAGAVRLHRAEGC